MLPRASPSPRFLRPRPERRRIMLFPAARGPAAARTNKVSRLHETRAIVLARELLLDALEHRRERRLEQGARHLGPGAGGQRLRSGERGARIVVAPGLPQHPG